MADVRKHDSSPELLVVQKTHGLVDQSLLVSYWLQLVQVHTLKGRERGLQHIVLCIGRKYHLHEVLWGLKWCMKVFVTQLNKDGKRKLVCNDCEMKNTA